MSSGNAYLLAVLKAGLARSNPVRSRFAPYVRGVGVAVGARVPAPIGIRTPAGPTPICSDPRWSGAPGRPHVCRPRSREHVGPE